MSWCLPEPSRPTCAASRILRRRSRLRRLKTFRRKSRFLARRGGARRRVPSAALPAQVKQKEHCKHKRAPPAKLEPGASILEVASGAPPVRPKREGPRKGGPSGPAARPEQRPPAVPDQQCGEAAAKRRRRRAPPCQAGEGGREDGADGADGAAGADLAALRERLHIRIEDDPLGDCPPPIGTFEELAGLPEFVRGNLRANGMKKPLPIQAQALPLVMAGRDVIGLAQTGSGKTLAFLLPVPAHMASRKRPAGREGTRAPCVSILAPTRELAVQIAEQADKVFAAPDSRAICTACVYGGGDKRPQQQKLRWGVDIVVATPGRLLDFMESGVVSLEQVSYFVLDEADRMLDLGFHDDVTSMVSRVRKDRQVLFFSATWNTEVQKLAQGLCRSGSKPVRISYGQGEDGSGSAEQEAAKHRAREEIVQEVVVVDHGDGEDHWERQEKEKKAILEKHLRTVLEASPDHKVLVFVSMKQFADEVSAQLRACGFSADSMHGGKSQEYRLWVLDQFRKGELRLLVCTDVLGRGIDIPSVSHVVIHEMGEVQDYIHRIGRTARGRHGKGHALVFFEYWEGAPGIAAELIDVLVASKQVVPEGLRRIADEVAQGKRKIRQTGWSK